MKWFIFRLLAICLLLSSFSPADARTRRWDKREHWSYTGWERIKPKNAKIQYAGGMGLLSFGAGWEYGKRDMWGTDAFIGFIPKRFSDKLRFTFTLKQTVTPWSIRFCDRLSFEPLETGIYLTTINGEEFWKKEPGKYPNSYYNFSSKIRFSVLLGQSLTFYPRSECWRSVSLFYEVGTNDLYVVSKATNSTLKMKDILRFSFGLKLQIRSPRD